MAAMTESCHACQASVPLHAVMCCTACAPYKQADGLQGMEDTVRVHISSKKPVVVPLWQIALRHIACQGTTPAQPAASRACSLWAVCDVHV